MLKANDAEGKTVLGWDASRLSSYFCPECKEALVFKRGRRVVPHFAHKPPTTCSLGVGESARHLEMKASLQSLFGEEIEYEVPLIPDHRADAVLARQHVVIECQASKIAESAWERRTRDYSKLGWPVLWVWDSKRLREQAQGEYRIPTEILLCHRMTYGRIYVLAEDGSLSAVHLSAVCRWGYSYFNQEGEECYSPDRYLKQLRHLKCQPLDLPLRCTATQNSGLLLATLRDGAWWKHQQSEQNAAA